MKKAFIDATIVTEKGQQKANILVSDEIIEKISTEDLSDYADEIIDCSGKLIFPGFIDPHTHMELQQSEQFRSVDDFYQGSKAAALGGTTMIIDHIAFSQEDASLYTSINHYRELAKKAAIDYSFHGVFQRIDEERLEELAEIIDQGIPSFKAYTTYAYEVKDRDLFRILEVMKKKNGLLTVHCENDAITNELKTRYIKEGKTEAIYHALSRPGEVEAEAVSRLIYLAKLAGDAPLYIVHTSAKRSIDVIRNRKREGFTNFFIETCTQYLLFNKEEYFKNSNEEGLKYMMAPPLRDDEDLQTLWKAIFDGTIDVLATDHCPFMYDEKLIGKDNFSLAPGGVAGVQERGLVFYSEGVLKRGLSLERFVELMSTNAAKIFGMYPKKGTIAQGSDADLVVFDPKGSTDLKAVSATHCDYTIYDGIKTEGAIEQVYLRGNLIVDHGEFLAERGNGEFVNRVRSFGEQRLKSTE